MTRVFVDSDLQIDRIINLNREDSHHIAHVTRHRVGDFVEIVDATGSEFRAFVVSIEDGLVSARVSAKCDFDREPNAQVTIYQGLPKQDKMELIIEKGTEVGAIRFVPVTMQRSVVKLTGAKADKRLKRWQRIAESAAKQAKRQLIPNVSRILTFAEMIFELNQTGCVVVPYEGASSTRIRDVLCQKSFPREIAIVIGPEGGFSRAEIEQLSTLGAHVVTLGPRILRTETAGFVALTLVLDANGDMGGNRSWSTTE